MHTRIGTIKDWESWLDKKDRTLREWAKQGKLEWTGETRRTDKGRMEKLYVLPEKETVTEVAGEAVVATTGAEKPVVEAGKPDPLAEKRQKIAELELDIKAEELDVRLRELRGDRPEEQRKRKDELKKLKAELDEQQTRLETWQKSITDQDKRQRKTADDQTEYDEQLAEQARVLDAEKGKAALVRKWIADTVKVLTSSETWAKAYHEENAELPEWPVGVKVDDVLEWDEQPEKKRATKAKGKAKGKKPVDSQFDDGEDE